LRNSFPTNEAAKAWAEENLTVAPVYIIRGKRKSVRKMLTS
jgi:hypothetical protein